MEGLWRFLNSFTKVHVACIAIWVLLFLVAEWGPLSWEMYPYLSAMVIGVFGLETIRVILRERSSPTY